MEGNLWDAIVFNIYPRLTEGLLEEISWSFIRTQTGYNSNDLSVLQDALRGLLTKKIELAKHSPDGKLEQWEAFTHLSRVKIDFKKDTFSVRVDPELGKRMYNPKVWG